MVTGDGRTNQRQSGTMEFIRLCIFSISLWTGLLITGMNGQRDLDVNIVVPSPTKEGGDLTMQCLFAKPFNTSVSSVKWYKGQREIFRFEAKPQPTKKVLPFGSLTVDEANSDMHKLKLKNIPAFMTGEVSCEVTLEDPRAKAMMRKQQLLVVVPPKEKPTLIAKMIPLTKSQQQLVANCTSGPAKPATNLTFLINDVPVYESQGVLIREIPPDPRTMLPTTTMEPDFAVRRLELDVHLQAEHYMNGKVRLKCTASQYNVYNGSSDDFEGERLRPATQKQGQQYFRRGSAAGIFNPSWTILNSVIGKLVLTTLILWNL